MKKPLICDTTLRDGEQMPGVVFSRENKIDLAQKISNFGANIIEIMPAISKDEYETAQYLVDLNLDTEILASTMMRLEHIDLAKKCGLKRICMFSPVSEIQMGNLSGKENLERAIEYVDYAREKDLRINFAEVDATRADKKYLVNFINSLEGKVDYFFPCDSVGILTPRETRDFVYMLKNETNARIGLHCHNDFGQAVANSLAGLEAGADIISGTFCGIGERAGNAALEEIVMSLREQYKINMPLKYELINKICESVSKYSNIKLQKHKPIIGENYFTHESGIHVDAVLKNPRSYENFSPEDVGGRRRFIAGKHSGKSLLKYWFGDAFSDKEYEKTLETIKEWSRESGISLERKDVLKLLKGEWLFDGL